MRICLLTALMLFGCSSPFAVTAYSANDFTSSKTPTTELNSKRKQQLINLLKQDCGSCHGMTLKGGLGPALLPENLENKSTLFIKNTITFGRPGTAMPPWQGLLTQQEILWLTTQLQKGIINESIE